MRRRPRTDEVVKYWVFGFLESDGVSLLYWETKGGGYDDFKFIVSSDITHMITMSSASSGLACNWNELN